MRILGKTKEAIKDRDFREILFGQIISISAGLFGGLILSFMVGRLELIPGLLVLIPGLLELKGNILGSVCARLSTKLHTKELEPKFYKSSILYENIISSLFLSLIIGLLLGVVSYTFMYFVFGTNEIGIIFVALLTVFLSIIITLPLSIRILFWLFKHKYEPDDMIGPYVTTIADIVGLLSLAFAVVVIF